MGNKRQDPTPPLATYSQIHHLCPHEYQKIDFPFFAFFSRKIRKWAIENRVMVGTSNTKIHMFCPFCINFQEIKQEGKYFPVNMQKDKYNSHFQL